MPSWISTVRLVGVPSSSIESEPRRCARVPSSTTVTPLEATRWPIRPAKAEVFLRLKSPSNPWPTASCNMMPGQPGARTTSISPAGAGVASRLISACRTRVALSGGQKKAGNPPAPAIPVTACFLSIALTDDHRDVHTHQRAHVAIALAVPAQDLDHLPACAE